MKPRSFPQGAAVLFNVAGGDAMSFQCEVMVDRALTAAEAEQKAKRALRQFAKELAESLGRPD